MINNKIKIAINTLENIMDIDPEIDTNKLCGSLVFFADDVLYNKFYKKAYFIFDLEKDTQGCFFVHEEILYFIANPQEINKACKNDLSFPDFKRSLFFTILHEIGHGIEALKIASNKNLSVTDVGDQLDQKILKIKESLKEKDLNLSERDISRYIPSEIRADRFAFSNLHYFINLYEFKGCFI
jgi:hypothetical protein